MNIKTETVKLGVRIPLTMNALFKEHYDNFIRSGQPFVPGALNDPFAFSLASELYDQEWSIFISYRHYRGQSQYVFVAFPPNVTDTINAPVYTKDDHE
jgi:hypothetical protein